mgnify:CR=1 FL=1|jgi:hypothetical protein
MYPSFLLVPLITVGSVLYIGLGTLFWALLLRERKEYGAIEFETKREINTLLVSVPTWPVWMPILAVLFVVGSGIKFVRFYKKL